MEALGKKEKSDMSSAEKKAKMDVLKELIDYAMSMSGDNVAKGMQELTVAAPDKESLMEGVEKAEEMLEEMPEEEDMMKMMSEEDDDMYETEEMVSEDDDEDEDEVLKKLRKR